MNATSTISIIPVSGGNDLMVGMPGLAGMLAIAITLFMLFVYDRYISKEKIMTNTVIQSK